MARYRGADVDQEKPRSDAYVGMLIVALVAQVIGIFLLALDWSSTPEVVKPLPQVPARTETAPKAPEPGGGVNP